MIRKINPKNGYLYECENCLRLYGTRPDECSCGVYPYDRGGPQNRFCNRCGEKVLGYRSVIPILQNLMGSNVHQPFWMELCGECLTTLEKVIDDWFYEEAKRSKFLEWRLSQINEV